jgi:hypothetical protein
MQKWMIQKAARSGRYLNSPKVYVNSGIIEDDSPENAIIRACFAVGSSEVRIVPIYECQQPWLGDK